ncbi:MAG: acyl carrier protein [Phaeodactylibacter sp.]|nr:acyl carrier protein [Phaeodactylibacter sp.]MCB9048319.1 acyl carrier protein [Lewinellaceae bacterium]
MEKAEIQTRVIKVISGVLGTEESMIGEKDNFIFDLGADSMQSLQLVAGFEEAFDIEMDEDKALEVQTVDAAVDFIAQYL